MMGLSPSPMRINKSNGPIITVTRSIAVHFSVAVMASAYSSSAKFFSHPPHRVPAGHTNDTFSPGLACSFRKEVNACVENHCVHSDIQSFVSSNCSIPVSSSKQSFMTKDTPCEIQCKKSIHGQSAWIISFVDCQSAPPSKVTAITLSGPMRSIIFDVMTNVPATQTQTQN